ncbi:MAG: hypothetical protein CSA68_09280 [Rhodobacterales bacterium]|nr:MAG: hypothetical protein CSA68_09280 [Rhodobacterales bacterium]
MTQAIQKAIDAEKNRQSRIDAQRVVTPPHQIKRLEEAQMNARVALARKYGHRLDARVSERIIDGMILLPEVLCTIGGGVDELPNDAKGWDRWAANAVSQEPLAQLSIDASDAALKEELRKKTLAAMRPEQRLQMARAGTLDDHIEGIVREKIEARAGV